MAYTPKSRIAFWEAKFDGNVARDLRAARKLRRAGWHVVTVWECQTSSPAKLRLLLERKLLAAITGKRIIPDESEI